MDAQNHFFSGGFKFNLASVKNYHNYKNKYFECVFGCMVRNITGRATTPDTTVCAYYRALDKRGYLMIIKG